MSNMMNKHAYIASGLVTLGVATGSLLAPQTASALDLKFFFDTPGSTGGSVEGLITGLVDNTVNQVAGVAVSVSNNGGTPAQTGFYTVDFFAYTGNPNRSRGFTVSNGQIVNDKPLDGSFTWFAVRTLDGSFTWNPGDAPFSVLWFFNDGIASLGMHDAGGCPHLTPTIQCKSGRPVYTLVNASVPGPLPLFGVAAAFGYSRKLRKRIKSSANPVSSSYAS